MATDKSKSTKSTAKKDDEEKTAGVDKSQTVQTTDAEKDKADETPTKVEESGATDPEAAASGSYEGAVERGDTGLGDDEVWEDTDYVEADEFEGALGTVVESDRHDDSYEVPWAYLTVDDFKKGGKLRTADSDDGDVVRWNAQWANEDREDLDHPVALTPVQGVPGQTFRARELPNVDVMKAAGIDPAQFLSGLPVRLDLDDEAPRKGIPA